MAEFTFEGNGEVESLDTIPEKYRGLYAESEKDGKKVFGLTEAARPLVGDYVGTNKALASARGDKTKASNESAERRLTINGFGEVMESFGIEEENRTADGLKDYITELTGKAKGGEEMKVNLDKVRREMTAASDEALAAKDTKIAAKDAALSKHLIGDVASRELAAAKGSPELLMPIVRGHCKVVEIEDGNYQVRVVDAQGDFRTDGAGGFMGVKSLVEELKDNEKYSRAFESESKAGGGAPAGGATRNAAGKTNAGGELSANEKIAIGLQKGQYEDGRGRRGTG